MIINPEFLSLPPCHRVVKFCYCFPPEALLLAFLFNSHRQVQMEVLTVSNAGQQKVPWLFSYSQFTAFFPSIHLPSARLAGIWTVHFWSNPVPPAEDFPSSSIHPAPPHSGLPQSLLPLWQLLWSIQVVLPLPLLSAEGSSMQNSIRWLLTLTALHWLHTWDSLSTWLHCPLLYPFYFWYLSLGYNI